VWIIQDGWLTEISIPNDISIDAVDSSGAKVTYSVSATHDGASTSVSCTPESGSIFSIGETAVLCTAATGRTSTFTVTVNEPEPIPTATKPGPPRNFKATAASATEIDLSWESPAAYDGPPVSGYKIEFKKSGDLDFTDLDTTGVITNYQHAGLSPGTTYSYKISAINSIGASNTVAASAVPEHTEVPTNLVATAISPTTIILSWNAPSQTYGFNIVGYIIERVLAPGVFETQTETTGSQTSVTLTGLQPGQTYTYVVSTKFNLGQSPESDEASATTTSSGPSPIPTSLTNLACDWGNEEISDSQFLNGIQDLLDSGKLILKGTASSTYNPNQSIPAWVNNNAGWWCDGQIAYVDFENGLLYLLQNGYLRVGDQTDLPPSITVSTDRSSYKYGDTIRISGFIRNLETTYQVDVTLLIQDSRGDIVSIAQLTPNSDGSFAVSVTQTSHWELTGTYSVKAKYGGQEAETTFYFTGGAGTAPTPLPDCKPLDFVDQSKDPQYYLDRYYNERTYKEWFDSNYPGITIEEGVCLDAPTPSPTRVTVLVNVGSFSAYPGDSVRIFGTTSGLDSFSRVRISITDPNGNTILSAYTTTDYNGKFNTSQTLPRNLTIPGKYTVTANVGVAVSSSTTASFELRVKDTSPSFSVNVETDQSSYNQGDIIVISGKVSNPQDYEVVVRVTNPRDVPVYQQNLGLKSDGSFSDMLIARDDSKWIEGTFTVKATHNDKSATSSFRFIDSTPTPTPSPSSAKVIIPQGTSVPGCEESNECWIPSTIRVSQYGEVTWRNDDTAAHTVTSGIISEGPDGNFDSSLFMAGTAYSVSFDSEGTFSYFCMVHPWMKGTVIVGDGGPIPPPPSPSITISVSADQAVYDLGDIVNLQVKISGTSTSQNVGVSVSDPTGKAVVSRSLSTDRNGNADFEFGIHEDFKTGTYLVAATSSIAGVTYKDDTHFKIQSQFNQIRIVSVEGTDQQGNPSSFSRGEMVFVKVVVTANKPIASLITVNLFDSELTTIGIGSFRTTLSTGESEMILSFLIPEDAATGAADIYANAFSDWPSNGGVPLTSEFSAQVRIT